MIPAAFLSGWLVESYGRKKTLLIGGLFLFVPWFMAVFANHIAWLYVFRIMAGIGGAMITIVSKSRLKISNVKYDVSVDSYGLRRHIWHLILFKCNYFTDLRYIQWWNRRKWHPRTIRLHFHLIETDRYPPGAHNRTLCFVYMAVHYRYDRSVRFPWNFRFHARISLLFNESSR